jgi:hypothetical protein
MLQKDDAWPKLLFDYHKAILPTWDFGIGMGANWLNASSKVIYHFNEQNHLLNNVLCSSLILRLVVCSFYFTTITGQRA